MKTLFIWFCDRMAFRTKLPSYRLPPTAYSLLFLLLTFSLQPTAYSLTITNSWDVLVPGPGVQRQNAPQGDSRVFAPRFLQHGKIIDLTATTADYLYQTNGMTTWWQIEATTDPTTGRILIPWGPANDCGATRYQGWVRLKGASTTNYLAELHIYMFNTPGFLPNALAMPVQILDFAQITVSNPPYLTIDQAATSNAADRAYADAVAAAASTNAVDPTARAAAAVAMTNLQSAIDAAIITARTNAAAGAAAMYTAATNYAAQLAAGYVPLTGGTLSGSITISDLADGSTRISPAYIAWTDPEVNLYTYYYPTAGGTFAMREWATAEIAVARTNAIDPLARTNLTTLPTYTAVSNTVRSIITTNHIAGWQVWDSGSNRFWTVSATNLRFYVWE